MCQRPIDVPNSRESSAAQGEDWMRQGRKGVMSSEDVVNLRR